MVLFGIYWPSHMVRVGWKVSSLPFCYSVQYPMERKSTKLCLNWLYRTQSGYELMVKELFESIFCVIIIFFLSVVDLNT